MQFKVWFVSVVSRIEGREHSVEARLSGLQSHLLMLPHQDAGPHGALCSRQLVKQHPSTGVNADAPWTLTNTASTLTDTASVLQVYTKKKVLVLYVNPDLKPIKSQASFIQISRRVSANLTIGQSASRLTAQLRSLTSSPMHRRTRSTPSANWQNASLVGQLSNDGSSAPGEGAGGGSSTPTSPQQPQQQGGALQATKSPHASKWSMPALSLPSARKLLFKNGSTPPMEDDS